MSGYTCCMHVADVKAGILVRFITVRTYCFSYPSVPQDLGGGAPAYTLGGLLPMGSHGLIIQYFKAAG